MDANPIPGHEEGPLPGLLEASASIEQHSKRQRFLIGVRRAVLGLGLLVLLTELGLRLGPAPGVQGYAQGWQRLHALGDAEFFCALPAAEGRYGLQAGAELSFDGMQYTISNQGTRGPDFERAKPDGEKRVLVLGSGLAMGLGVALENTLAVRLGDLATSANEATGSWRGINLAVPGYGAWQQAADLEQRGLDFEPDLVLTYFDRESVVPAGFFIGPQGHLHRDRLPLPSALRCLLWKSHVYRWIADEHRRSQEASPQAIEGLSSTWVRGSSDAEQLAGLARIEAICEAAGVPYRALDQAPDAATAYALLKTEGLLP